jgi:hypothetical protein
MRICLEDTTAQNSSTCTVNNSGTDGILNYKRSPYNQDVLHCWEFTMTLSAAYPRFEQRRIVFAKDISLSDLKGQTHHVTRISMALKSVYADIWVELETSCEHSLGDDASFMQGVLGVLRDCGYKGPDFGRAELGTQSHACVVLEPGPAFKQFASRLGWTQPQELTPQDPLEELEGWSLLICLPQGPSWQLPLRSLVMAKVQASPHSEGLLTPRGAWSLVYAVREALEDWRSLLAWARRHLSWEAVLTLEGVAPYTLSHESLAQAWADERHPLTCAQARLQRSSPPADLTPEVTCV